MAFGPYLTQDSTRIGSRCLYLEYCRKKRTREEKVHLLGHLFFFSHTLIDGLLCPVTFETAVRKPSSLLFGMCKPTALSIRSENLELKFLSPFSLHNFLNASYFFIYCHITNHSFKGYRISDSNRHNNYYYLSISDERD